MAVRNYDPEMYMVVFGGRTITGLAAGTPITAGKEANRWETYVGFGSNPDIIPLHLVSRLSGRIGV